MKFLSLTNSFFGLCSAVLFCPSSAASHSIFISRSGFHSARNFSVKAGLVEVPLDGNKAPDFKAEAVSDQEFIKDVLAYTEPNKREMIKWLIMHPANKLRRLIIGDALGYSRCIDTNATL